MDISSLLDYINIPKKIWNFLRKIYLLPPKPTKIITEEGILWGFWYDKTKRVPFCPSCAARGQWVMLNPVYHAHTEPFGVSLPVMRTLFFYKCPSCDATFFYRPSGT